MASPSPAAVAAIRAHVTDWTQSPAVILAALNAPSVNNPVPQATVPKPFTALDLIGAVGATRRVNLAGLLSAIRPDLDAQNAKALAGWAAALELIGVLVQADVDALTAVITATELDPAYTAQIGWALATLGRAADLDDVILSHP